MMEQQASRSLLVVPLREEILAMRRNAITGDYETLPAADRHPSKIHYKFLKTVNLHNALTTALDLIA